MPIDGDENRNQLENYFSLEFSENIFTSEFLRKDNSYNSESGH